MRYLSVCSGIEAATVAWAPLGWTPVAFSEIGAFPSAVLSHYHPTIPNLGDMNNFKEWPDATIDLLVGGTPCQSFSVAGLRAGLDDPRGSLMLTYLAIARRYRPRWLVWENVPGVLSTDGGRPFGTLLGGLAELGYGFAYRVLDAQYFGLAQRRKRVFVVGHLGTEWRRAAAVLFERESLSGYPPPRRKTREDLAGTLGGSSQSGGFRTTDLDNSGAFIVANPLLAGQPGHGTNPLDETIITVPILDGAKGRGDRGTARDGSAIGEPGDPMFTLRRGSAHAVGTGPIPFDSTQITHPENRSNPQPGDLAPSLAKGAHPPAIAFSSKDYGGDVCDDVSPTLRSGGFDTSHANGGVMPAIAFRWMTGGDHTTSLPMEHDHCPTLDAAGSMAVVRQERTVGFADVADPVAENQARTYTREGKNNFRVSNLAISVEEEAIGFEPRYYTRDNKTGGAPGDVSVLKADASKAGDSAPHVQTGMSVRRLTPRECERLQGFPDDYTRIPYRGKPASDGPRYSALGNSMAVPVMRWIGERIAMVDAIPADPTE